MVVDRVEVGDLSGSLMYASSSARRAATATLLAHPLAGPRPAAVPAPRPQRFDCISVIITLQAVVIEPGDVCI